MSQPIRRSAAGRYKPLFLGAERSVDCALGRDHCRCGASPVRRSAPRAALALLDAHRCRLYLSGPKERQHYQ